MINAQTNTFILMPIDVPAHARQGEEKAMFNLSDKDYRIAEHVQAEMRRQADEARSGAGCHRDWNG